MKPIDFYLVTDTHYFENSLGVSGKAFDQYMKTEQYFMEESASINKAIFKQIAEDTENEIVLMPGDLSKNGEIESHKSLIKELYKCKKTILGDFGQCVNPYNSNSLSLLSDIFENSEIVKLNKSYRSTYEIIKFSEQILKQEKKVSS